MFILESILGSLSLLSLGLSGFCFIAGMLSPTNSQDYNTKYNNIIFYVYGVLLLASSGFFGFFWFLFEKLSNV